MKRSLTKTRRFARGTGGSIAMMTGIMFPIIAMLSGAATDIGRAYLLKNQTQKTLDSTVLGLARSRMTDAEIEDRGERIFTGDMALRQIDATVTKAVFKSEKDGLENDDPSTVSGEVTLVSNSLFLGIFGLKDYEIIVSSEATKPNPLPYEIAMVLDVSGSMKKSLNGAPRITRLKESALALFDELERQSSEDSPPAISLVPYSTSVSLGGLGTGILEGTSVGGNPPTGALWAAERFRGSNGATYDLSDDSPDVAAIPFITEAEIGNTEPQVPIQPLTTNGFAYRNAVQGLKADGYTSAHVGMIWGLYTLSPKWKSVWSEPPREYGDAQKIIVLLTDGAFNTTHAIGAQSNDDGDESNAYFQSACALAKQNDVVIYAVALSLDAQSEARLSSCAANSGGKVLSANSAESLKDAFEEIAQEIGGLRISS